MPLYIQAQKNNPQLLIIPEQQSWTAGTDFVARSIVEDAPTKEVQYFFGQIPLPKDTDGSGIIKFRVAASTYDAAGQTRKQFKTTACYKEKKQLVTLVATHSYLIQRPHMVYTVPAGDTLYMSCGNELFVTCPELGTQYNPSFQASGSIVIRGSQKGQVTLVPTYQEVILKVYSGGTEIDGKKFKAIVPPAPKIRLLQDQVACTPMQAVSATSQLYLTIEPDSNFSIRYPKDARYRLEAGSLKVIRNGTIIGNVTLTNQNVDLSALGIVYQQKDVLIVEITKVNRINFLNQTLEERGLTKTFELTIQ